MLETGIATVVAVLGGVISVAAAGDAPDAHRRRLLALVSAAAGALIAVTFFSILPEARENLSLPGLVLAAISGYILYYLVGRYLFPICPACVSSSHQHGEDPTHIHSDSCSPEHHHHPVDDDHKPRTNFRNVATLLGLMVAAHAAVDGIAIASGHHHGSTGSAALSHMTDALPLLFALSLHKLPEGLALTALLISSGFRRTPALLLTTGIELATLLGGALGVLLRDVASPYLLSGIMAHVGGGFLYLAFQALRNEAGEPAEVTPQAARSYQWGFGTLGFVCVSLILLGIHRL